MQQLSRKTVSSQVRCRDSAGHRQSNCLRGCILLSRLMLYSVLAMLIASCSANDYPSAGGQGRLELQLGVDPSISMDDGSVRQVPASMVPSAADLSLTISSHAGLYEHTWEKFSDFTDRTETYLAGEYTAQVYQQDSPDGADFGASAEFAISQGQTAQVSMTARPRRALVDMRVVGYDGGAYSLDSLLVHPQGGVYTSFAHSAEAFVKPGPTEFYACLSDGTGRQAVLLLPLQAVTSAASGISVRASGGLSALNLTVSDKKTSVTIDDATFSTAMPKIEPSGFTPGTPLKAAEGVPPSSPVAMHVTSLLPVSSLMMSVQSDIANPAYAVLSEVDLLHPTPRQQQLLDSAGITATFNDSHTAGDISFTRAVETLSSLQTATTAFTVIARTADGKCSLPMCLTVDTETVEMQIVSSAPAVIGIDRASVTLHCNSDRIERGDFRLVLDSEGRETCPILDWKDLGDGTVDITFGVPAGTADFPVAIEYLDLQRLSMIVRRVNPTFSALTDAFAKTAIIQFEAPDYDGQDRDGILKALTRLSEVTVNGLPASIRSREEAMSAVIVNGLTPGTRYAISIKLADSQPAVTIGCTTESTQQLPSSDFADWRTIIEYKSLPSGGQYSATEVPVYNRQNYTDIKVDWPKKHWASLNAKTFYRKSAVHNTWYMQPSAWVENSGLDSKAVCIASVGWDHEGGPIAGYIQQPGDYVAYSKTVPQVRHRSAGRLWLGRYNYDGTGEAIAEGVEFSSRPSSLNGLYKYLPDLNTPGDRGYVAIELVNINPQGIETVVAQGRAEFEISPDYKAFTVPLSYKLFNVKPTQVRVMFVSTREAGRNISADEDRLVPVTADLPAAAYVGSRLWITSLMLSY